MSKAPQAPKFSRPYSAPDEARPGDSVEASWVEHAPAFARPYLRLMRLDRPIGVWLLFWPSVFGLILGAFADGRMFPNPISVILMGLGAIVMRGAGCTYNDIIDRDFDANVARTRGRPIPSGAVSVKAAAIFAVLLSLIGFFILISFNRLAIILGVSSLLLIAAYPFMKRITWWPQAWLGLTFNWGVLLGFAAEASYVSPAALVFYAGTVFWTLGYDTIYAHQDKEDDALIGVKSTARYLGQQTKPWLYIFYGAAFALMLAGGLLGGLGFVYAVSLLAAAAHLLWQVRRLDIENPLLCLKMFRANRDTAALIAAALLLGAVAGL